jgi:eukaryotic-like serine/threonine-protein kinase
VPSLAALLSAQAPCESLRTPVLDTTDTPASDSLVGATLGGKYKLTRLLGVGGMGAVYEATNANTGRRVAIKTLHTHLLAHTSLRQRFLQEARASTQIDHPNVIDVLDLDVDGALGVPYIVQEFLSGHTLADRLDAAPARRLFEDETLRIAVPVMGALVAAHARGIVHRDLKPENIFLVRDRAGVETPRVIDFGIAKFVAEGDARGTRSGAMLGTPAYMSPEQAMGLADRVDAQTDVWAMGVVLYEMLSGRLPYEAETAQLTLGMIQYRDPVPLASRVPSLPSDLVAAIDVALTKDRAARYPTMQAFLGALLETDAWSHASQGAPSPQPTSPAVTSRMPTLEADAVTTIPEVMPASLAAPPPRRAPWVALGVASLSVAAVLVGVALSRTSVAPSRSTSPPPAAPVASPPVAAPPIASPPVASPPVASPPIPQPAVAATEPAAPARVRRPVVRRVARPAQPPPSGALTPDREWHP